MIRLTAPAAEYISGMISKQVDCIGIRFGVKKSGCSGLSYQVDFISSEDDDAVRFESFDIPVYVKREHLQYIDGTEIDFVKSGLNRHMVFNNPNVQDQCGCGMSFSI